LTSHDRSINVLEGFSQGGEKNGQLQPVPADGVPPPLNRNDHREGNDDYTQAGNLFRLMSAEQKKHPINNIVGAIKTVPRGIQERQIAHFTKADPAYGQGVARGLGLPTG
jgi:catalase